MSPHDLFTGAWTVINVGLEAFAETLEREGVAVVSLDWHPPAGGNSEMIRLLERVQELESDGAD